MVGADEIPARPKLEPGISLAGRVAYRQIMLDELGQVGPHLCVEH